MTRMIKLKNDRDEQLWQSNLYKDIIINDKHSD